MIKFKKLTIALLALLSISATAWAAEATYNVKFEANGKSVTMENVTLPHTFSMNGDHNGEYNLILHQLYDITEGWQAMGGFISVTEDQTAVTVGKDTGHRQWITISAPFEGTVAVSGRYYQSTPNSGEFTYNLTVSIPGYVAPLATINEAKTEATIKMPQYDVTATYALKRDMTVDMAVSVADAQQNSRFRVQKQGNNFVPVGLTNEQVMALFKVHDDIEEKDLTAATDYTVQIFAVDDNGDPTGNAITFQNFTYAPGQYIVKAVAAEGSNYSGTTALSNVFVLFQGYEVEIAAQSFATYYSEDEALTLEESFAETAGLYTVAEVTPTEAVLSEKIDVMPKRTPMLIYNESETAQQILLIPTADVAPLTDVADEFKGTAVEKVVTAEEIAATNFYVLTDQNQFVWVKDAGTIAAHRCWLEIAPSEAAGARRIVFSGSATTGISTTDYTDYTDGTFYDLNGRKLQGIPTVKGVYIFNGKKVVVK